MDAGVLVKEYGLSPIHTSDQKKSVSTKNFSQILHPEKIQNVPPKTKNKEINKTVNNSTISNNPSREINKPLNVTPKNTNTTVKTEKNESEKKKILNDLKMRLNNEMLAVLEEEQNKELERDDQLEKMLELEKKNELEKKFGIDRALAQKRIQELSE